MAGVPGYDPTRLFTALQNTGLSNRDNPLYQVIYLMIQQLINLTSLTSGLTPGGGGSSSVINNLTQQLLLSDNFSPSGDDNSLLPIPGQNVTNVITQIIQQLAILDSFNSSGDDNQLLSVPSQANIVNNVINQILQQLLLDDSNDHQLDNVAFPLLPNVAFTNQPNIFTENQLISKIRPSLDFKNGTTVAQSHLFSIGIATYLTNNVTYDGTNFNLDDTSRGGLIFEITGSNFVIYTAPSGANPAVTTSRYVFDATTFFLQTGQIQFPSTQLPSANVNTLDDYEEGTFTPVDGSGAGLAFTSTIGLYTKIGDEVYWAMQCVYPVTASGATGKVGGLPFASNGTGNLYGGTQSFYLITGQPRIMILIFGGTTQISTFDQTTSAQLTNAQLSTATLVYFGMYKV